MVSRPNGIDRDLYPPPALEPRLLRDDRQAPGGETEPAETRRPVDSTVVAEPEPFGPLLRDGGRLSGGGPELRLLDSNLAVQPGLAAFAAWVDASSPAPPQPTGPGEAPGAQAGFEAASETTTPPAPSEVGGDAGWSSAVRAHLAAVKAREAGLAPDADIPRAVWLQSRALERHEVSAEDVRHLLRVGSLPDRLGENGAVLASGAERLETLDRAARGGDWTAANALTFLVGLRRAALSAERSALEAAFETFEPDDPDRFRLAQAISTYQEVETTLKRGLNVVYREATEARERGAQALLLRAERLDSLSARAESEGERDQASRLGQQAATLRTEAARRAHEEAQYRVRQTKAKWDASSCFLTAAEAQIAQARTAILRGNLSEGAPLELLGPAAAEPDSTGLPPAATPCALRLTDNPDAGQGVPNAAALLATARQPSKEGTGGRDHRTLALEGQRCAALAAYHRRELVEADPDSSPGAEAHFEENRRAYFEARAGQAEAAEMRLELFGNPHGLAGDAALEAAYVAAERLGVIEELAAVVANESASLRAVDAAARRCSEAHDALDNARQNATAVAATAAGSAKNRDAVRDRASPLLGDAFKTRGEARRDAEAVEDAKTLAKSAAGQADAAQKNVARAERELEEAKADLERAEAAVMEPSRDAARVGALLWDRPRLTFSGPEFLRNEADRAASFVAAYVGRAEQVFARNHPASAGARTAAAGLHVGLANYHTRAAEIDAQAGFETAAGQLDAAETHLEHAETARKSLPSGDAKAHLTGALVSTRAALAEARADDRPHRSLEQLERAEALVAECDDPRAAKRRVGSAAVRSLIRQDLSFERVRASDGHSSTTADQLYHQAHRLLDDEDPERDLLREVDEGLDAVPWLLDAAEAQLKAGQAEAEATTRSLGRAEIEAAQAQQSILISGPLGLREKTAEAGEGATEAWLSVGRRSTEHLIEGKMQLGAAFSAARAEGRPFELLGYLRTLSSGADAATASARTSLDDRVPSGTRPAWAAFHRVAVKGSDTFGPASPAAHALAGPVMGLRPALGSVADPNHPARTPALGDMIEGRGAGLEAEQQRAKTFGLANMALEAGLGIAALRALPVLTQAPGQVLGRSAALRSMRAAHPVFFPMATSAATGAGMLGVSFGARRLFGEGSAVAQGVDVLTNFAPIGGGYAATVGFGESLAASGARRLTLGGQVALRRGAETAKLVASGSAQAFATALAIPAVAEPLGVTSELGQAVLGLALGAAFTGGVAAHQAHRHPNRAKAAATAEKLAIEMGEHKARPEIETKIEAILHASEGRLLTERELGGLKSALSQCGTRHPSAAERAASASVDRLQAERALELSSLEVTGTGLRRDDGSLTPTGAARLIEIASAKLLSPSAGAVNASYMSFQGLGDLLIHRLGAEGTEMASAIGARAAAKSFTAALKNPWADPPRLSAKEWVQLEDTLSHSLGQIREDLGAHQPGDPAVGPAAVEELTVRLAARGIPKESARAVAEKAVEGQAVEHARAELRAAQAKAPAVLPDSVLKRHLELAARKAGLPEEAIAAWAKTQASAQFRASIHRALPTARRPLAIDRQRFLDGVAPEAREELVKLEAEVLARMYPGGALPQSLEVMGKFPGFADFARSKPAEARSLVEAVAALGNHAIEIIDRNRLTRHERCGFERALDELKPQVPTVRPHPTHEAYWIIERGPKSPSTVPAVDIRLKAEHDHNRALQQPAAARDAKGEREKSKHLGFDRPHVGQLHAGVPLRSLDRVLVLSTHGSRHGFTQLDTKQAAAMVAEQIAAARAAGTSIEHVVLSACSQRDRRGLFNPESNAEAFQTALDAELAARGLSEQTVTVLAAEDGGYLYGPYQKGGLPVLEWKKGRAPKLRPRYHEARFRPAADGSKLHIDKEAGQKAAAAAGAIAVGAAVTAMIGDRATPLDERRDVP